MSIKTYVSYPPQNKYGNSVLDMTVLGNSVPLEAWTGPEGSRSFRLPDFVTTAQDGGKVVSLTHRPPLLTYSMVQSLS